MGRRNKDRWRDKLFQQKLEEEKQGIYGIWERWEGRDKETVDPEIPTSVSLGGRPGLITQYFGNY